MTKKPITVPMNFTVEETAEVLLKHKINGVPVMDEDNRLTGVITQTDLFRVIISLTGIGKRGFQFGFRLEDRPGSIKEVADVIRQYGGKMVSILTSYDDAPEGCRWVYIRFYDVDRSNMERLKQDLRNKAKVMYMVDHRENSREIYA
jgi:acetoin utilization protein AcuB